MTRRLVDDLRQRVQAWIISQPERKRGEPDPPPTYEDVKEKVVAYLRMRADAGCSTARFFMSTADNAYGPGFLGTTENPDEDEAIMERVTAFLLDEDVMANCHREDVPDRYDDWYKETAPGYTAIHLSVGWAPERKP